MDPNNLAQAFAVWAAVVGLVGTGSGYIAYGGGSYGGGNIP